MVGGTLSLRRKNCSIFVGRGIAYKHEKDNLYYFGVRDLRICSRAARRVRAPK